MMPLVRCSGEARNTLLPLSRSILADGCIACVCRMRETCKNDVRVVIQYSAGPRALRRLLRNVIKLQVQERCGRFHSDQDSARETVMTRIRCVMLFEIRASRRQRLDLTVMIGKGRP